MNKLTKILFTHLFIAFGVLSLIAGSLSIGVSEASAQGILRKLKQQRRQERAQKRIDRQGGNKLTPPGETTSENQTGPNNHVDVTRPLKHSLDGISQATPRDFANRFFTKDERLMAIPGFGRAPAFLIILRQLDLTEEQQQGIKAIRQRVGNQLQVLRAQHGLLEYQLEDVLYGEKFDAKRVEELSAQAGEKQAEITRLQASIESQMRQVLTPDQFYVFRFLIGEMLLPQRRQPFRQLQQRRMGQQLNQQNRPPGVPNEN